jgi:hypothetical protein
MFFPDAAFWAFLALLALDLEPLEPFEEDGFTDKVRASDPFDENNVFPLRVTGFSCSSSTSC